MHKRYSDFYFSYFAPLAEHILTNFAKVYPDIIYFSVKSLTSSKDENEFQVNLNEFYKKLKMNKSEIFFDNLNYFYKNLLKGIVILKFY